MGARCCTKPGGKTVPQLYAEKEDKQTMLIIDEQDTAVVRENLLILSVLEIKHLIF